jgi:hypothetical protein
MLVLIEIEVLILVVTLLELLHHLICMPKAPCNMSVILWWSTCED